MECRYADGFVENAGRKMRLERGSVVGAVSWLGHRWNWTPQTVRTFLDKLEDDGMILRHVPGASENNKHVGRSATIISVCNYDKYQNPNMSAQQTEQQTNSKQTTNEQQQYKDNKGTKEQDIPPTPKGAPRKFRDLAKLAFDEWCELAVRCRLPVPKPTSFTDARARSIIARMVEHAGPNPTPEAMIEIWRDGLRNIERSKFLRGMTAKEFRADLTFMCQSKSFTRLIEGTYGNGAHAPSITPETADSDARLADAYAKIRAEEGYEIHGGGE